MRKEVKLGMAIGGGLVALLIAYLLIAPPSNNKKGTQLAGGNTHVIDVTQPGDLSAADASSNVQAGNNTTQVQNGNPASDPAKLDTSKTEEKIKASGDSWKDQLEKGKKPEIAKTTESADKAANSSETQNTNVLETTSTPRNDQPRVPFNPNDAWGGGLSTDGVGSARPIARTTLLSSTPTTRPSTKAGQHVVKSGETFSSIALAEYGSSAYYPHLIRANPTVNPNNLKLGTIINVPAPDEVKASTSDVTTGQTVHASVVEPRIDPAKQYKVQSGDSLYKISLKLYGKNSYVDRIYEKNKAAIGPNPTKLKLGMILELPEAVNTTGNASAARDNSGALVSDTPVDDQPR